MRRGPVEVSPERAAWELVVDAACKLAAIRLEHRFGHEEHIRREVALERAAVDYARAIGYALLPAPSRTFDPPRPRPRGRK